MVVESAQQLLARFGVLDLFAGLPPGEELVALDGRFVHYREVNVTGSSGGGPWDVAEALRLMAAGAIDAAAPHRARRRSRARSGAASTMAREQALEGKAVVYPHRRPPAIATVRAGMPTTSAAYLAEG